MKVRFFQIKSRFNKYFLSCDAIQILCLLSYSIVLYLFITYFIFYHIFIIPYLFSENERKGVKKDNAESSIVKHN